MTVRDAWRFGVGRLAMATVPTQSRELDARVLLAHVLVTDTAGLFARYPEPFPADLEPTWTELLQRRGLGEPVAWLVGRQEFMGLEFAVGPGVLVPRADTETLVEAALELLPPLGNLAAQAHPFRFADVCTGSGCVALSLAALTPARLRLGVVATDLSDTALGYARANAERLLPGGPTVEFHCTSLLTGVEGPFDLIVSNPPYLTPSETEERVGPGGWKEPALALDGGGEDGLDLVRKLVSQAQARLVSGGWLLVEAADAQAGAIEELFGLGNFEAFRVWKDLGGQRRVFGGQRKA